MNRIISWLKNTRATKQILTAFFAGVLLFLNTACSPAQATDPKANVTTTTQEGRSFVPDAAIKNKYEGGMNDFSDQDPRTNKSTQTYEKVKTQALKENAERNVIDQTSDIGENTKRILDKKGENAADFGKNLQRSTEKAVDKAQDKTDDLIKGTKRGVENIKDNTKDAAKGAAQNAQDTVDDAKYNVKQSVNDTADNVKSTSKSLVEKAQDKINDAGDYMQTKTNQAGRSVQRNFDKAGNVIQDAVD